MSHKLTGWDLIERKQYRPAVDRLHEEYEESGSDGYLVNAAIAYLMLGDPESAFGELERVTGGPEPLSTICDFKGIAEWMLGRYADAVATWTAGLECDYQDESGGMALALFLYFAAVRKPRVLSMKNATAVVQAKSEHEWAENWPGPIGEFLLGRKSEKDMRRDAEFEVEIVTVRQMNQAEFYVGVSALRDGSSDAYYSHVEKVAKMSGGELLCEFHLARHELSSKKG
jgi:hypothetical protein